jgi:CheY-like chemotaxis protein/anti-sigma regulatory factor (Ser/Thr protein kinase)
VDDILDASRFLRDDPRLNRKVMEIGDVLASALDVVGSLVEEKRHKLVIDVPKAGLLVEVDAARIVQVFGNILNNAAKYTEDGGLIAISAASSSDWVTVTVADNGIGIPADVLPRVFELFTQAEQGIDRRHGGLGIGLAVVKRLVESHGGEVTAESAGPNRGSRFTVRLPRYASTPALEPEPESARPQAALPKGPAYRILVVDDNQDGAEMLRDCLEDLGHEVRVAFDGPGALEVATAFLPAVVFLDVGLPGLSGYEVARRLRQLSGWDRVPIVAVTGYARDSDRALALEAGFSSHMAKPIDIARLRPLIDDLIRDSGAKA